MSGRPESCLEGPPRTATGFNVYRAVANAAPSKLNEAPQTGATFFLDEHPVPGLAVAYSVRAVVAGTDLGHGNALHVSDLDPRAAGTGGLPHPRAVWRSRRRRGKPG